MWWLKARRVHTHIPAGVALFTFLAVVIQDTPVPLPTISISDAAAVQAIVLVPLVLTSVLFNCLESRLESAESSGIRWVRVRDVLLAVGVVVITVPLSSGIVALTGNDYAETLDRNTAFLVGLTLLCGALFGSSAVLLPALWPVVVIAFGLRSAGDPYPWTVLLERPGTWYATTGAAMMLSVGAAAHLFLPRRHV